MQDESLKTKYPILLVHGAGFRDLRWPLYWGRIPRMLMRGGAAVYYGQQDSWGTVEDNAKALKARIEAVLAETGAEKVNIIAHSKGGLEARMAAASLDAGGKIASITTIGTPHCGSRTVDALLRLPDWLFAVAAFFVDHWIRIVGDTKPDFRTVCKSFSTEYAARFNAENPDVSGIVYSSYGGVMKSPFSDGTLWLTNLVVRAIEGENDGLVTLSSAAWGGSFTVLRGNGRRGISHCDEVDLRRKPISGKAGDGVSDICDVYAAMVAALIAQNL